MPSDLACALGPSYQWCFSRLLLVAREERVKRMQHISLLAVNATSGTVRAFSRLQLSLSAQQQACGRPLAAR